ncbi:uncharacterized protein LOC135949860 [Calliphora vicina]|uniref:uncharacterized protein LOC135949860 n=1 Tax=Calliphora vicina TaxID=7373 RepID=UPI00325AE200
MAELDTLVKQRETSKANVTRIKNLISSSMSLAELECRLSLVEAYFKQLLSIQTNIEELNPKDTARIDIEDLCIKTKSKIIELLGDNYKRQSFDTSIAVPFASHSKLPSLELPKFDGKYSTYKNFMSSFKQFVDDDSSLSNIEKFNNLLHCLSGQALDTVRAFQITADNYEKAIKRLEERYDNKTLIFIEHIQNLYDLPNLNKSSGMQLRSLVDSASAIYGSLKSLGTAEDICNALIIHLISQKSDKDTQIKWRENLDYAELPSWDRYCKYLERRCQFLESAENFPSYSGAQTDFQKRHTQRQQNYRSAFYTQQKNVCFMQMSGSLDK